MNQTKLNSLLIALLALTTLFSTHAMEKKSITPKEQNNLNERLCTAVSSEDHDSIQFWLKHGADVNAKSNTKWTTSLIQAALHGDLEMCKFLLDKGALTNKRNRGYTALTMAAQKLQGRIQRSHNEVCALLLDHGADLSKRTFNRGSFTNSTSPLQTAAAAGNIALAEFLIKAGALVNAEPEDDESIVFEDSQNTSSKGWTALQLAAQKGYVDECRALLTHALFNPHLPEQEFQSSRNQIYTALLVLKRYCPALPKDIRKKILCNYDQGLKQALINSAAFGLYCAPVDQAPFLPLRIVGLYIKNGKMDKEKAINAIFNHTMNRLAPLTYEALRDTIDAEVLNLFLLQEDTVRKEIKTNIERRLMGPKQDETPEGKK